ncbi:hypothetical protein HD554DRAFT_254042 [Boletus coccyginus]|nr:hypothetical protein HD554DRAFT_254042 [Boletus coccyginus]
MRRRAHAAHTLRNGVIYRERLDSGRTKATSLTGRSERRPRSFTISANTFSEMMIGSSPVQPGLTKSQITISWVVHNPYSLIFVPLRAFYLTRGQLTIFAVFNFVIKFEREVPVAVTRVPKARNDSGSLPNTVTRLPRITYSLGRGPGVCVIRELRHYPAVNQLESVLIWVVRLPRKMVGREGMPILRDRHATSHRPSLPGRIRRCRRSC